MNFNDKYKTIISKVKDELEQITENIICRIDVQEPLQTNLKTFLKSPSKHIRPTIGLLFLKSVNEEITHEQIKYLTIIELIHNASLVHDDIIDRSEMRRGKKSIRSCFGDKLAVVTGDYLLCICMEMLTELNHIELFTEVCNTIKRMCIGEINQDFSRYKKGTIDEYITKTRDKTGYLFGATLAGITILAKNNKYDINSIRNLGINIGIAFQIRDDILNMTNEDYTKPRNSDIQEGIYNAPIILGDADNNYETGIEKTKHLMNNYIQAALLQIKQLPNNEYTKTLMKIVELINNG